MQVYNLAGRSAHQHTCLPECLTPNVKGNHCRSSSTIVIALHVCAIFTPVVILIGVTHTFQMCLIRALTRANVTTLRNHITVVKQNHFSRCLFIDHKLYLLSIQRRLYTSNKKSAPRGHPLLFCCLQSGKPVCDRKQHAAIQICRWNRHPFRLAARGRPACLQGCAEKVMLFLHHKEYGRLLRDGCFHQ